MKANSEREGGEHLLKVSAPEGGNVFAGAALELKKRGGGKHWGFAFEAENGVVGFTRRTATEKSSAVFNVLAGGRRRWKLAAKGCGLVFKLGVFLLETAVFFFSYLELLAEEGEAGFEGFGKGCSGENGADGVEGIHTRECAGTAAGAAS